MGKINFIKAEDAFDKALQKMFIDRLYALANPTDEIQDSQHHQTSVDTITHFQKELKKLKKQDAKLYERLSLTEEDEKRLTQQVDAFTPEDWSRLETLKLKLNELKQELHDERVNADTDDSHQISEERRRHIHKRHNIRDGWLPLH